MRTRDRAQSFRPPMTWHCTPFCHTWPCRDPVKPDEVIETVGDAGAVNNPARGGSPDLVKSAFSTGR